jgi:hypothetical protein
MRPARRYCDVDNVKVGIVYATVRGVDAAESNSGDRIVPSVTADGDRAPPVPRATIVAARKTAPLSRRVGRM